MSVNPLSIPERYEAAYTGELKRSSRASAYEAPLRHRLQDG